MRLRRKRRSPPVDFTSLDRLAEVVEHVVDLIEHPPEASGDPEQPVVVLQHEPGVDGEQPPTAPSHRGTGPRGHVLVLPGSAGYRLAEQDGDLPSRHDAVELDGVRYQVVRYGASPLPGDARRCAFLEREDAERAERTTAE